MKAGIYTILNSTSSQALTYPSSGSKHPVKLECTDLCTEPNGKRFYQQQWLIIEHPDTTRNAWQIILLRFGFIVGARSDRAGSIAIDAAPKSLGDSYSCFDFCEREDGAFEIQWLPSIVTTPDDRCYSMIADGCCIGLISPPPTVNTSGKTQSFHLWHLHRNETLSDGGAFSSWLSHVPSNRLLSELSIPFTHQSLAIATRWLENPRCQERSILEQLNDGIRGFDLRFGVLKPGTEESCLYARHGSPLIGSWGVYLTQYPCFAAVLQQVRYFMDMYEQETVVLMISNEDQSERFFDAFEKDFQYVYEKYFYNFSHGESKTSIRLGDVRGKIILRRADRLPNAAWNGKELPVHGIYRGKKYWTTSFHQHNTHAQVDTSSKTPFENITANMTSALSNPSRTHKSYSHNWAANLFPIIKDPIDHAREAKQYIIENKCYTVEKIGKNGSKPGLGEVQLDFYNMFIDECVIPVVRSNEGCGEL